MKLFYDDYPNRRFTQPSRTDKSSNGWRFGKTQKNISSRAQRYLFGHQAFSSIGADMPVLDKESGPPH